MHTYSDEAPRMEMMAPREMMAPPAARRSDGQRSGCG
jgi:hypothetical protein